MLALVAGCGGPGSPFGLLAGFVPTEEELAEYSARIESLPSLQVRIVNNTDVLARVELTSGVAGLEQDLFAVVGRPFLTTVEDHSLLIAAGGTVTGSIKCGEVISVSVRAPIHGPGFGGDDMRFGLFLGSSNIQLTGAGVSDETFSGDLVSTVRFLRPDEDEIDCVSTLLLIEINTPATEETVDEDTGELIESAVPGTGTVTLE